MAEVALMARLTRCECGHPAVEHYDSHAFCTWTMAEPPECACEEFRPIEPEVWLSVGKEHVSADYNTGKNPE